MKNITKTIALILCILLIGSAVISCKSSPEPEKKENASENPENGKPEETTGDGLLKDNTPELDFEGYKYRVLMGSAGARDGVNAYPESENMANA